MSVKKLYRKVNLFLKKAENKNLRYVILISLAIVMSFILLSAGHFLFFPTGDLVKKNQSGLPSETQTGRTTQETTVKTEADAVRYIHRSEEINGLKQEINILEINPGISEVRIQPVLSHDLIYGFEVLSEMAARKKAYAAVTGGFFSKYGLPSGMAVIDGELISASTGRYPVFIRANGKAELRDFKSIITLEYSRKGSNDVSTAGSNAAGSTGSNSTTVNTAGSNAAGSTGSNSTIVNTAGSNAAGSAGITSGAVSAAESTSGSITADGINSLAGPKAIAVYTPYYGRTNRAEKPNVTATIVGGIVTKTAFYENEVEIPKNGLLISFFNTKQFSVENLPLKAGESVKLLHQPELEPGADAYECGTWLVRGGKSAVPLKDAWIGVLTNHDPRTAIGIKQDGTVVLLTVDGRQPGYSAGFTGQELADYLIGCGVKDAAMLDGGASAEMLVEGRLVSRPSYKGKERTLGGGILVLRKR
jgi:exopolysaccharide biosynthesis protein